MTKLIVTSFSVIAIAASTFAAPVNLRHSQPVKPAMTAEIPSPTCPLSDINGCGIYQ